MAAKDKLTVRKIESMRGNGKAQYAFDGGGLYLEVTPTGAKLWRLRYTFKGERGLKSLGHYSSDGEARVTLAQARQLRDEILADARKGIRPVVSKTADLKAHDEADAKVDDGTFKSVALAWHRKNSMPEGKRSPKPAKWSSRYADIVMSQLERYLFCDLGSMRISEINAPQLLATIKKIDSALMQAIVRSRASAIFRYAIVNLKAENNPAAALADAFERPESGNFRAIKPEQLPALVRAIENYRPPQLTALHARKLRAATQLLMLTFLRKAELIGARWSEIDLDAALWTVPAGRMKKTRANRGIADHLVPLSPQAVTILRELRAEYPDSKFVFPAQRKADAPINRQSLRCVLSHIGFMKRMTPHGFRSLASTVLNEQHNEDGSRKFDADVIERQLSHLPGGIRGVYNKAEYLPQRRQLMTEWANLIDEARNRADRGNVHSLDAKRRQHAA